MLAYLRLIRPLNGIMAAFAAWIGTLVAGATYPTQQVLIGVLAVFLISSGGMATNDYYDVEIDKLNKPNRPLPAGKISKKSAKAFASVLFAVGIALSYLINITALAIAVLATALLVLYAKKLKKTLLLGHVIISLLVALTFVFGGVVAGNYLPTLLMAFLAFLANTGREIYKSVEDILGDRQHDVHSLAVKYGVLKAKLAASMFVIVAVVFSFVPFVLGFFSSIYLFFVVIADLGFVSAVMAPVRYSAKLCKISMLIALFAFLASAVKIT